MSRKNFLLKKFFYMIKIKSCLIMIL